MKFLKKIADDFENYLCTLLMTLMVIVLFVQVVARYFLGTGVDWSEELSRFFFVWMVIWSIAYTSKLGGQIRVGIFLKLFPMKIRMAIFLLGEFIWAMFNALIVYEGLGMVIGKFQFPEMSPTVRINMAWIYTAVPLGFFFCILRMIQWHWLNRGEKMQEFLKGDMV